MATLLEENASQFGVGSSVEDQSEEIYAPVKLSNSTKRFNSAREMVEYYMEEEDIVRRLEIDRMEDEAYAREIEKRAKAAAWNDKVLAQRHGSAMSEIMVDLDPTQPDYLAKVDKALTQFPLAKLDPQIGSLLESRQAVFEVAQKQRDRDAEIQTARDNALFSAQAQQEEALKADAIRRERDASFAADDEISKMPPEGRKAYKDAIEKGVPRIDALALARDEDRKVITKSEYREAQKSAVDLDRSINNLAKQLAEQPDVINKSDAEYMRAFNENKDSIREQMERAVGRRDAIVEDILRPYEERIAGEKPKPTTTAGNPGPTVPQGDAPRSGAKPGSPMSVKSLLPTK